ncbi:MAG: hypothetical protein K0R15_832 [Clostridiales bacterium]|jgi:sporulation protein YabP|nr:hypothetical protein [Bacillales bacterium]MDF2820391.1 hypothetical protein [Clostridiales bacterium]
MDEKQQPLKGHRVTLNNRKICQITGVDDVLAFDAEEIILDTEQGILTIKGSDLHVNRVTVEKGEVDIEGDINNFSYSATGPNSKNSGSVFGRLFK